MVPGMTERERLANDLRLVTWLAEAVQGPTPQPRPLPTDPFPTAPRRVPALLPLRRVAARLRASWTRTRQTVPNTTNSGRAALGRAER